MIFSENEKEMFKDLNDWFSTKENLINDDNRKINIGGKELTLGEFRKMEKELKDVHFKKKERYKLTVFWDDVIQYTTLGFIDFLRIVTDLPESIMEKLNSIEIKDFFKRDEVDGIDYLLKVVPEFDKDEIKSIFKKYYDMILRHSPVSALYDIIGKSKDIFTDIFIIFDYKPEQIATLDEDLKKQIKENGNKTPIEIKYGFINGRTKDEFIEEFITDDFLNLVITNNGGDILYHIINREVKDATVLLPGKHHNVNMLSVLECYDASNGELITPYNTEILFYDEIIRGYKQ